MNDYYSYLCFWRMLINMDLIENGATMRFI